jgi:hypothetical protein
MLRFGGGYFRNLVLASLEPKEFGVSILIRLWSNSQWGASGIGGGHAR